MHVKQTNVYIIIAIYTYLLPGFNEISDGEMIYLWRMSSPSHKVDREDETYKYIEVCHYLLILVFMFIIYVLFVSWCVADQSVPPWYN